MLDVDHILPEKWFEYWPLGGAPVTVEQAGQAALDELVGAAASERSKAITRAGSMSLDDLETARKHASKWRDAGYGYLVCGWPGAGASQVEAFAAAVLRE